MTQRSQTGFSLIELMLAMVMGLMLIGGMFTIFTGGLRSSELNQTMASLQSNARFALDLIGNDVRMAGFQGCASTRSSSLKIRTNPAPTNNMQATAIAGFKVGMGAWSPAQPAGYIAPVGIGAPIIGTHALLLQYASLPGNRLEESMVKNTDPITIKGKAENLYANEYAVISNCDSADLFKVTSLANSGANHKIQPDQSLSQAYIFRAESKQVTRVMPFINALYYVGDTNRTNGSGDQIRALYLQTFPYDQVNNPAVELIEGVDQLQLNFGVRQADNSMSFHAAGDAAIVPRNVDIIEIGLLMSSTKRLRSGNDESIYFLANQKMTGASSGVSGDAVYPDDMRMRLPINSRVKIRNRFPL